MPRQTRPIGTFGKISLSPLVRSQSGGYAPAPTGTKAAIYRARTRFRDLDGKTRLVEASGPTKARAEANLKAVLVERQTPLASSGGLRSSMTLRQAGETWLEKNEHSDLSAATRKQYADEFARYVIGSPIEGLTLSEVNNVGTIESYLQQIADESGSAASRAARRMLSNILNTAVRHRALPHSASREVRQPRPRASSASSQRRATSTHDTDRSLTLTERQHVIDTSAHNPLDRGEDVADLIAFLAGTGVRLSEALSHTWWDDLDLHGTDGNGGPLATAHIRGTKTDKADRVIPLPPWLAERLRVRKATRWSEGLVFGSPRLHDKTKPREKRNMTRLIRSRFDEAGLPWATSHTFRRTAATMMDANNAPLAEIANQLGHANVNQTATYLGRRQGSNRAASIL